MMLNAAVAQEYRTRCDTSAGSGSYAVTSRLAHAPQGIFGGDPGQAGRFSVNGEAVTTQARITLQPDDVVRLDLPGGGGYGATS